MPEINIQKTYDLTGLSQHEMAVIHNAMDRYNEYLDPTSTDREAARSILEALNDALDAR